ncbi:MAG: hypothetical protein NZ902_03440 [Acidilobaceae archaeon]|nr:hypothetical protein [Acidilobaceae archaeon]MCX8165217.1 hypothetical protein [Acidilobaceae archaeon]MDW7974267.1 hypothetical protein [Sulfolobales archaeon]
MRLSEWEEYKGRLLVQLREERLIGYLDPGAERYLELLNSPRLVVTTSSCIGRITVVEGEWHWLREGARIVFKTHDPVSPEELERVARRFRGRLWVKLTGPIFHLRTPSLRCASKLLSHARSSGFKHSGVISLSPRGHTVELMSGVQLALPLLDRELGELAGILNGALEEGRRRLDELASRISRDPGACEP